MGTNNSIGRIRFTFTGIVQGVGFRPTVFRCAVSCGLAGFVQNRRSIVVAEVEGKSESILNFRSRLTENLPEAALVESIETEKISPLGEKEFRIIESGHSDYLFPPIPPDLALCDECRKELLDPENRRYLYPFITCTQCGPRYSIVEDTPFDRETTSMSEFHQCPECTREYTDPLDRRFHSQTNSCSVCGPRLSLVSSSREGPSPPQKSETEENGDPLLAAIEALGEGKIVAVQGIGGFHLAANPSFPDTVRRLRKEKERKTKPFALMVRDREEARRLCHLGTEEEDLLSSPASPIVILPARSGLPEYLKAVSDTDTLGIMLPYTPLHLLLFFHPRADIRYRHLIMTSGNRRKEPIITDPLEAREKLSDTADLFLFHDRRIVFSTDDSVLRPSGKHPSSDREGSFCIIRRSRGYVPRVFSLALPVKNCTLAAGGDLKNAPAFADEDTLYLAPYIGDLEQRSTMEAFERSVERILRLYRVKPRRIVYDLHPEYYSTRWALDSDIEEKVPVQHHHAHILSVMAEHGLTETLGVSFDGTGYGTDGTIWGGEFLLAGRSGFSRLGSLSPFPLPGGEEAIRKPIRIAYSLMHGFLGPDQAGRLCASTDPEERRAFPLIAEMLEKGFNSPLTSSAGRIFDAAAALLGMVGEVFFEGEGPIKMEGEAAAYARKAGLLSERGKKRNEMIEALIPLEPAEGDTRLFTLDPRPLIETIGRRERGAPAGESALLFHEAVAAAVMKGIAFMRRETGIKTIALSGGVFQNMLLREILFPRLREEGYSVYTNKKVSPGDGGIALGQAYYL